MRKNQQNNTLTKSLPILILKLKRLQMQEVKEITIICKNEEKTMRSKHLIYDDIMLSIHDPIISQLIRDSVKDFGDSDCSVKFKATMVI